jgi:hypothetical protein
MKPKRPNMKWDREGYMRATAKQKRVRRTP